MALIEVTDVRPRVTQNDDGSLRIQLLGFARYGRTAPRTCSVSYEVSAGEMVAVAKALSAIVERNRDSVEALAEASAMRCYHAAEDAGEEI